MGPHEGVCIRCGKGGTLGCTGVCSKCTLGVETIPKKPIVRDRGDVAKFEAEDSLKIELKYVEKAAEAYTHELDAECM